MGAEKKANEPIKLPCGCTVKFEDRALPNIQNLEIDPFLQKYYDKGEQEWNRELFDQTNDYLQMALDKVWKDRLIGIDYDKPDWTAVTLMESSIYRFGWDKSLATVLKLNEVLRDSKDFSEFKNQALKLVEDVNINYLRTEYNYAVSSAQNGANWIRQKGQQNDFPVLIWHTIGDSRVRTEHAALQGKKFRVNDSEWRDLYPPIGWGCRCEMLQDPERIVDSAQISKKQTIEDAVGSEKLKKLRKSGLIFNSGEQGEVFSAAQSYAKSLPKSKLNYLSQMTHEENGLISYKDMDQNNFPAWPGGGYNTPEQAKQAFLDRADKNGTITYLDKKGRPVFLTKESFDYHTSGKYLPMERYKYFDLIDSVISNPDEVFYNKLHPAARKDNVPYKRTYFKYYNGKVMTVEVDITEDRGLHVRTWYEATNTNLTKEKEVDIDSMRLGLHIKN